MWATTVSFYTENSSNSNLFNFVIFSNGVLLALFVILTVLLTPLASQSPMLPCRGQMYTNGSFHVGQVNSHSANVYNYSQEFWNNGADLDCTFNQDSVYSWTIDRVDITSSGGVVCLGGGLGYPWYRFRIYGRNYSQFHADLWVSWRGSPKLLPASPAYLVECVPRNTDQPVPLL